MRGIQGANLNHIKVRVTTTSVVDPNTLNLDPDPEFRTNFGPDLRVMLSVLKNDTNSFREKKLSLKKIFKTVRT